MSEERKIEIINTCSWWASWRKDVIEHSHCCDRFQNVNKATGERFGLMIHSQEPSTPREIFHVDWVNNLPPGGEKSQNACLVIVDRYRKNQIFFPFHKADTAMDTALLISHRVISHNGPFENIISEMDPKFTSAL
ncbi:hypothetical protein O181_100680 [Austropuccinia psidii MF-1]|uniref:Integrase catalytic domain-containing protein n=1 Tax=Austropuccinia psidii MF-1 TaxID=1389203 RepID=A0A9Q3JG32_9BASI|nr:hypothetical protein [Austropuccinia psidii MF-1]